MVKRISRQTRSVAPLPGTDPAGFLNWAFAIIPAQTKFVLAGVIVFAGAALALGWTKQYGLPLTFSIALLILVFGLAASAISAVPSALSGVGRFLAWALAILLIVLLVLLLTSTFFGWPPAGSRLMARILGSTEILANVSTQARPIDIAAGYTEAFHNLPQQTREEVSASDPIGRVQALSALPEISVAGVLEMGAQKGSTVERRYLSASTLRLDGGAILTNGGNLVIEVNNLVSDDGKLRGQDPAPPQSASNGKSGGQITLIVHGKITGNLSVELSGGAGAAGAPGADGARGPKGGGGANASSGLVDCQRGAEAGGKGGRGARGSDGKPGTTGGKGGVLIVRAIDIEAAKRVIGAVTINGGGGGVGGKPGAGGPGGDGGDGGSPVGFCSGGGPTGPSGDAGSDGDAGASGANGADGKVTFESLPGI